MSRGYEAWRLESEDTQQEQQLEEDGTPPEEDGTRLLLLEEALEPAWFQVVHDGHRHDSFHQKFGSPRNTWNTAIDGRVLVLAAGYGDDDGSAADDADVVVVVVERSWLDDRVQVLQEPMEVDGKPVQEQQQEVLTLTFPEERVSRMLCILHSLLQICSPTSTWSISSIRLP